jgi:hypothetical protein
VAASATDHIDQHLARGTAVVLPREQVSGHSLDPRSRVPDLPGGNVEKWMTLTRTRLSFSRSTTDAARARAAVPARISWFD